MTPYYIAYALVLSGVPICLVNDEKLRRQLQFVYFSFTLPFLVLFVGLRAPYAHIDYLNYLSWFQDIAHGEADSSEWLRDPIFSLISWVVSAIGFPYLAVTLIFAAMSITLKWYLVTLSVENRWMTLFFYLIFCRFYIMSDLAEIRAAVAIPLMAISLYLACKSKRRVAFLVYLLAVAFHFSMILALPVLFLLIAGVEFRSRLWVIALVLLAFVASVNFRGILESMSNLYRVSEYLRHVSGEEELTLKTRYFAMLILPVLIGVFVVWKRLSLHYRVAVFCSGIGVSLFVLFIENTVLASRFVDVFEIYVLLLFVVFVQLLRGNKRLIYLAVVVVMGFGLFTKEFNLLDLYSQDDPSADFGSIIRATPMNPSGLGQLGTFRQSEIPRVAKPASEDWAISDGCKDELLYSHRGDSVISSELWLFQPEGLMPEHCTRRLTA